MIHAYKMNGYNIIIDQNSGCVHSVDEVAFDIITRFENESKADIKPLFLINIKTEPMLPMRILSFAFRTLKHLLTTAGFLQRTPLRKPQGNLKNAKAF